MRSTRSRSPARSLRIERSYGALLDGAGAGIAARLDAFHARQQVTEVATGDAERVDEDV
jgi:hypothetical protein